MAIAAVLPCWLDDEEPELFSKTSPPLLLDEPESLLPDPLDDPDVVVPPTVSPTSMPMAELICCEMLKRSWWGFW